MAARRAVQRGGTLRVAIRRDATNLDTARSQDIYSEYVYTQVIETLFSETNDLKIRGKLVASYENPDAQTYIFRLVSSVLFQDGTPCDADAVRWNLRRHLDDPTSIVHGDLAPILGVEVVDQQTLRVTLSAPFAPFLDKLVGGGGYVYSPSASEKLGTGLAGDLTDAGTGPFQLGRWDQGNSVSFVRNPAYWQKDGNGEPYPFVDGVVFAPVPDEEVRLNGFLSGQFDMVDALPAAMVPRIQGDPRLVYAEIPGLGFSFIAFETERPPFNDKRVRQAFSYALDRRVLGIVQPDGRVADTPLPPAVSGSVAGSYQKRDVARAQALLDAAGSPSVDFTLQYSAAAPELERTIARMGRQTKPAGFAIAMQPLEFSAVVDNAVRGDYQAIALSWFTRVDPDDYTYKLFYSSGSSNFAHYANPALDALLDQARQTLDDGVRANLYRDIAARLDDDEPFVVYDWPPLQLIAHVDVRGLVFSPILISGLYRAYLAS